MAATVLSGTGNVSFTNNTGQNARILLNKVQAKSSTVDLSLTGTNGTVSGSLASSNTIGKSFPQLSASVSDIPTELAVENTKTFSLTSSDSSFQYNILVIPESG
jgi:hypothetical protein